MDKQNITTWLYRIALALVCAIPVTVLVAPLPPFSLLVGLFFFPYISAKTFFFRILIDILLALVIGLSIVDKQYRPKFSWISITGLVFVLVISLADMLGVNPLRSIWSNFERMEGLVTLLHLAGYFIVLTAVLTTTKLWHKFFAVNLSVAGIVVLYGLLQNFGLLAIQQGGVRIDGPFGNAAYFATYIFFALGITVYRFLASKSLLERRSWQEYTKFGVVCLLFLYILYLTGTRGGLVGLGVTICTAVVGLLYIYWNNTKAKRLRIVLLGIMMSVIIMVGGLWFFRDSNFVQNKPMLARAASAFNLEDQTVKSRLTIWQNIVFPGFKERPLLGWGQENFVVVFGKYYDPSMYNQEPWFDRTHNTFLDWLIAGGVLGLASYLAILGAWLYTLVRVPTSRMSAEQKAILVAIMAGYLFQNLVIFDNLTSYLWFVALLAYVHSLYTSSETDSKSIQSRNEVITTPRLLGVGLVVVVMTGVLWVTNLKPLYANVSLISALQSANSGDLEQAMNTMNSVLDASVQGDTEARENLIRIVTSVLSSATITNEQKQPYVDTLLRTYTEHFATYPDDVRSRLALANFFAYFGQLDQALVLLDQAAERAPKKQMVFMMRARVYGLIKDYPKALNDARYAFELDTSYKEARLLYIGLAKMAGEAGLAKKLESEISTDELSIDEQINIYTSNRDYAKLAELWKIKLARGSDNLEHYVSYAASLYALNKRNEAVEVLESARVKFPTLTGQLDVVIAQVKAGTIKLEQ